MYIGVYNYFGCLAMTKPKHRQILNHLHLSKEKNLLSTPLRWHKAEDYVAAKPACFCQEQNVNVSECVRQPSLHHSCRLYIQVVITYLLTFSNFWWPLISFDHMLKDVFINTIRLISLLYGSLYFNCYQSMCRNIPHVLFIVWDY